MASPSRYRSYYMALAVLLGGGILLVPRILELRQELRAKSTLTCMRVVMGYLDAENPPDLKRSTLEAILRPYRHEHCVEDAWGHPLLFEREVTDGRPVFTIVSVGRDGARGPCCRSLVEDWNEDAVLREDRWLQVWRKSK